MKDLDYYMNLNYKIEVVKEESEGGYNIPEPSTLEKYSGQFKLRIPKSLHMDLAEQSKQEGISMNQYCLYLLSKNISKTSTIKEQKI